MLTKTTTDLVISPIENMIKKVQAIATNPIKAVQEEENEQLALEELGDE
jgi:3-dehydroquinate synthase class II